MYIPAEFSWRVRVRIILSASFLTIPVGQEAFLGQSPPQVPDRVFQDQVPTDNPRDQFPQRRIGIGVGRAGYRHHRRHFSVAERGKGTDYRRDSKRKHQRWAGARARRIARGRGTDGRKNAGADDCANAQQSDVDGTQRALQLVAFHLRCSQDVVKVFGAKESAKQGVSPELWIRCRSSDGRSLGFQVSSFKFFPEARMSCRLKRVSAPTLSAVDEPET